MAFRWRAVDGPLIRCFCHALRTESAHEMLPLAHVAVYNTPTNTATDKEKKMFEKRLVSRLNLYLNLRYNSTQFGI